jgi:hypothetical protein
MEEQPSEIWWRPFVPVNLSEREQIRSVVPKCIMGVEASEKVTIYPRSGLISVDNQQLFACRTPLYPLRFIADVGIKTEKQLWHEVISNATNVGLSKEEDNTPMIFFTMFGDSFENNENQPFGLWATLQPIPFQRRIIRPLRSIVARKKQQQAKALAWAAAGHSRLGNQIVIKALRTVAENIDLTKMIILAVLTTN